MEFKVEKKPKSQVVITITCTEEETNGYREEAFQALAKHVKLDGFRPGKVPVDMVKDKISDEMVRAEMLERALPKMYAEVVTKEQLKPVSQPKADITNEHPIAVTLTVDVFPEVTVGDYKKISVTTKPAKVTDKDIEAALKSLQESFADYVEADRAAKKDDRVEIDFEGFDSDKQPIAGAKSQNHPVVLGSNVFVAGFEDNLVGTKKGDKKEFTVTFPKDYHAEEMRGMDVTFAVTVHAVEERRIPPVDDSFAGTVTGHKIKTLPELKEEIKKSLEQKAAYEAGQKTESEVLDKLYGMTKADLPISMLEEEMAYMIEDFVGRLKEQGLTLERFLEAQKLKQEAFEEQMRKSAEKRILTRLALNEIAAREKIDAADEEIDALIAQVRESGQQGGGEPNRPAIRVQIRIDKTLKFLFDSAMKPAESAKKSQKPKK